MQSVALQFCYYSHSIFLSLLTSQFAQLLEKHIKQAVPLWKLGSNLHRMQISEGAPVIHMETSFLYEWYKNSK